MKKIFLLCTVLFLFGCKHNKTITISGQKYILISPGKTNSNGINDIPLYEKIGVSSSYYTPSIDGKSMVPIMK